MPVWLTMEQGSARADPYRVMASFRPRQLET